MLWLLGVEVLPNLHLATHEADHTHEADGTIVRGSFGGTHSHGGVVHADRDEQLAIDVPAHGAAGIAHRAVALHQPSPPVTEPLAVTVVPRWIEHTPNERLLAADAARPAARGPPAHG